MAIKNEQHVVPHPDGWAVKIAGKARATSVHPTQQEAVAKARAIARAGGGELLIHGRDGAIRDRRNFGKDPYSRTLEDSRNFMNRHKNAMRELAKH